MKTERDIVEAIIDLLRYDDDDEFYLEEGEQAELACLEWALDREFTPEEEAELKEVQAKE
jgi:hypothetical protein